MGGPNKANTSDGIHDDCRAALVEEVKAHHESSRQLFSIFATWWTFVCTANITALGAVLARPEIHWGVAPTIALFDLLGSGFCLVLAIRLVQTQDRVKAIFRALYDPTLPQPEVANQRGDPSIPMLVRRVFTKLTPERTGDPRTPGSSIPLGFYLWCIVPVMLIACPVIAALWFVGWLWDGWLP